MSSAPNDYGLESIEDVEFFLVLCKDKSGLTIAPMHANAEQGDIAVPRHGRIGQQRWADSDLFVRPTQLWSASSTSVLMAGYNNRNNRSSPESPDQLEESALNFLLKRI